jgi:hypothetical protein
VTEVLRKTLYIRELDIFLIGDVVTAVNSAFKKKVLLHALQTIEIDTDVNTLTENERKGINRFRNVKSSWTTLSPATRANYLRSSLGQFNTPV